MSLLWRLRFRTTSTVSVRKIAHPEITAIDINAGLMDAIDGGGTGK